jgi:hypothetical protein
MQDGNEFKLNEDEQHVIAKFDWAGIMKNWRFTYDYKEIKSYYVKLIEDNTQYAFGMSRV